MLKPHILWPLATAKGLPVSTWIIIMRNGTWWIDNISRGWTPKLTSGEGRYRLVSSFFQYNPILTNPPADLPPKLSAADNIVVLLAQWSVIIEFIVGVYQTPSTIVGGTLAWMDGWKEWGTGWMFKGFNGSREWSSFYELCQMLLPLLLWQGAVVVWFGVFWAFVGGSRVEGWGWVVVDIETSNLLG